MRQKKAAVVGMGRTGVAVARLLLQNGIEPFLTDCADADAVKDCRTELDALDVSYECGGHTDAPFKEADLVVLSPGVPPETAPVERARRRGVPVISEMEYAYQHCTAPILAVTGTNGKTTTTELLHGMVCACGHNGVLAGNNAHPFSEAVMRTPSPDYMVLEVSSYQLESTVLFRPRAAAVLNISPDHLARHRSLEAYAAAKARIFAQQGAGDAAVLNADDEAVAGMPVPPDVSVRTFSLDSYQPNGLWVDVDVICAGDRPVANVSDVPLPGRHNLENALAALAMARAANLDWSKTIKALRGFQGVEHRLEYVGTIHDVAFYNDSKSTNIDSLKVALDSFAQPIILIAGGRGKGGDYRVLRDLVRQRAKALVVMGEDGAVIKSAFGDLVRTEHAGDMDEAVRRAGALAAPGDIVLLSPACASFDMFSDFEHRGRVFKACVAGLSRQTAVNGPVEEEVIP